MTLIRSAALTLLAISIASANAQDAAPAIATDRPTVGTIADIVPTGSLQTEGGVGISYSAGNYAANLPQAVFRLGLGRRTEFLFAPSNEVYVSSLLPLQSSVPPYPSPTLISWKGRRKFLGLWRARRIHK